MLTVVADRGARRGPVPRGPHDPGGARAGDRRRAHHRDAPAEDRRPIPASTRRWSGRVPLSVEPRRGRGRDARDRRGPAEVLEEHRPERAIVAPAREGTDIADVIRLLTACGVQGVGASAHARGDRDVGRVRRPGRQAAAGRAGLRALAVVAGAQADLRPRRGQRPSWWSTSPFLLVVVIAGEAQLARAGDLPADADRVATGTSSGCGSSARWCATRTSASMELLEDNEAAPAVQDRRRPQGDAGGPLPPAQLAGRAAPAHQRASRRHEHGGAAAR